jgi:hypothetical protein
LFKFVCGTNPLLSFNYPLATEQQVNNIESYQNALKSITMPGAHESYQYREASLSQQA